MMRHKLFELLLVILMLDNYQDTQTYSGPNRTIRSQTRAAAVLQDEMRALISLLYQSGILELRHNTSISSALYWPLEYSLTHGIWTPSSNMVLELMDMLPGTLPPTSLFMTSQYVCSRSCSRAIWEKSGRLLTKDDRNWHSSLRVCGCEK